MDKQAYRITEFCAAYGIGKTKTYEEIAAGRLTAYKVGCATLISREAALAWQKLCESESQILPGPR